MYPHPYPLPQGRERGKISHHENIKLPAPFHPLPGIPFSVSCPRCGLSLASRRLVRRDHPLQPAAEDRMTARLFRRLLVANRSEIAIRVFRTATELGIRTVAIYSHEDRFALHRFKADEAYLVGKPGEPIRAYLDIAGVVAAARQHEVDAIHPGYGFLSENPNLARACEQAGLVFIGPRVEILE